jgi:lipopolysaccharide heptosyltransferase I
MKILIIKPSSLGDIIHALPFLKTLRGSFRDAEIEWVISTGLKDVLDGNQLVDKLITFDKDSWKEPSRLPRTVKEIAALVKTLRSKQYDMVIDLQGLLRSGLMTFFSRSPRKIGFRQAREGSRIFYNQKISSNGSLHAVDRCLEVARYLDIRNTGVEFPITIDKSAKRRVRKLTGNTREYVVIAPSARWSTKRWPSRYFGLLISRLSVPCVITGSRSDDRIVREVLRSSGGKGLSLCSRTDLKELIALISESKVVVSNDSGPLHIGAALGVPVVALFGPTEPGKTGPYGWKENRNLKVIRQDIPCSPCFRKKCKDPLCMKGIQVETVLEEIREYL